MTAAGAVFRRVAVTLVETPVAYEGRRGVALAEIHLGLDGGPGESGAVERQLMHGTFQALTYIYITFGRNLLSDLLVNDEVLLVFAICSIGRDRLGLIVIDESQIGPGVLRQGVL